MKKVITIFLLSALCFNSLGYYFMHNYLKDKIKSAVKKQIKEGVPENELVNILYSDALAGEFHWKHEREFSYKGKMYDIVSKELLKDGKVLFHCVSDEQETILFKNLNQTVNNSLNGNAKNHTAITMLYSFLAGLYLPLKVNFTPLLEEHSLLYGSEYEGYTTPLLALKSPPPKVVI